MSKRIRRRNKMLSEDEKLLIKLNKALQKTDDEDVREKLVSLQSWFLTHQKWSYKQKELLNYLLGKEKIKQNLHRRRQVKRVYQIYAIMSKDAVKVGFSSNVKGRILDLSVGSSQNLKLLRAVDVATNMNKAKSVERGFHRELSEYRLRGEWFSLDALPHINEMMDSLT